MSQSSSRFLNPLFIIHTYNILSLNSSALYECDRLKVWFDMNFANCVIHLSHSSSGTVNSTFPPHTHTHRRSSKRVKPVPGPLCLPALSIMGSQAPVHLFSGIWGMIATGLFATPEGWALTYGDKGGDRANECCGLFYGCGFNLLFANLALVVVVLAWVGGTSAILFYTIEVRIIRAYVRKVAFVYHSMMSTRTSFFFSASFGPLPMILLYFRVSAGFFFLMDQVSCQVYTYMFCFCCDYSRCKFDTVFFFSFHARMLVLVYIHILRCFFTHLVRNIRIDI